MTETYTVSRVCKSVCDGWDNGQQRRVKQSSILHNICLPRKCSLEFWIWPHRYWQHLYRPIFEVGLKSCLKPYTQILPIPSPPVYAPTTNIARRRYNISVIFAGRNNCQNLLPFVWTVKCIISTVVINSPCNSPCVASPARKHTGEA